MIWIEFAQILFRVHSFDDRCMNRKEMITGDLAKGRPAFLE